MGGGQPFDRRDRQVDTRLARLLQPGPRHALVEELSAWSAAVEPGSDRVRAGSSDAVSSEPDTDPTDDDRPTVADPILPGFSPAREPPTSPESGDRPTPVLDRGRLRSRIAGWRFGGPQLAVVTVIVVIGVLLATWAVLRARPVAIASPAVPATAASGPATPSTTPGAVPSATPTPATLIKVHVLGAVDRPGVVELPLGARVEDAITTAGGLTDRARLGSLNLAQPLTDGQQVFVAGRQAAAQGKQSVVRDPGAGGPVPGSSAATTQEQRDLINLNTATAEELEELPGVGPVTAEAILSWRAQHGRFSTTAELQEVDGIGPKTYADLAPLVTV